MFKNIFGRLFPKHFPKPAKQLIGAGHVYYDASSLIRDAMDITRTAAYHAQKGQIVHTPCPHCPPRWQVNA